MNGIKGGTVVRVIDGSWSLVVTKDGLKATGDITKENYVVICTGCNLPADDWCGHERRCDTIVRSLASGNIIFTREVYLRVAYCECCGQELKGTSCASPGADKPPGA